MLLIAPNNKTKGDIFMGKFNTSSLGIGNGMLSELSKQLKQGFEIINIDIDLIVENENNNYSLDGIDELVDSIRTVGLKQNLDVMKLADGKFKLLTGHRRLTALKILYKENKEKYKYIPCTVSSLSSVQLPISDESKEKYLIHITNATQRDMTDSDKYNQYLELKKIYSEAKKNGYKLTDKMRVLIANDMNLSPAQVGKIDYIHNNATDALKNRISSGEISIAEGNEIAHHSQEEQATLKPKKERIIDRLDKDKYTLHDYDIKEIAQKYDDVNKTFQTAIAQSKTVKKKDYAKILELRQKLIADLKKLEDLIN